MCDQARESKWEDSKLRLTVQSDGRMVRPCRGGDKSFVMDVDTWGYRLDTTVSEAGFRPLILEQPSAASTCFLTWGIANGLVVGSYLHDCTTFPASRTATLTES